MEEPESGAEFGLCPRGAPFSERITYLIIARVSIRPAWQRPTSSLAVLPGGAEPGGQGGLYCFVRGRGPEWEHA